MLKNFSKKKKMQSDFSWKRPTKKKSKQKVICSVRLSSPIFRYLLRGGLKGLRVPAPACLA